MAGRGTFAQHNTRKTQRHAPGKITWWQGEKARGDPATCTARHVSHTSIPGRMTPPLPIIQNPKPYQAARWSSSPPPNHTSYKPRNPTWTSDGPDTALAVDGDVREGEEDVTLTPRLQGWHEGMTCDWHVAESTMPGECGPTVRAFAGPLCDRPLRSCLPSCRPRCKIRKR